MILKRISVWFVFVAMLQPLCAQQVSLQKNVNAGGDTFSFDIHIVMKGETLYGISKTFHTTVAELLKLNPEIIDNNLSLGKQLKVPITATEVVTGELRIPENAIIHLVKPKETVYAISKLYSVDQEVLLLWNDLQTIDIKIGQQLIVGYETKKMHLVGPLQSDSSTNELIAFPNESEIINSVPAGSNLVVQKGIAVWSKEGSAGAGLFALHPFLEKGTLIQVTNLMNKKTITLKVIGKLPATMQYENIALKISAGAAKELNVLDEKFLVQISYVQNQLRSCRSISLKVLQRRNY